MKTVVRYIAVFIVCFAAYGGFAANAQEHSRVIEIHAKRFSFVPAEITLTKGETVTLSLTSEDVTHGLVIPDLGVNAVITKDKATKVDVTPERTGTFQGKCGHFCGVGHGSMVFAVEVKDK